MNPLLTNIKSLVNNLGSNTPKKEIELIDKLIDSLELYKLELASEQHKGVKGPIGLANANFKMEKISEERFLYKPVTVKNYYDGDYLERFSDIRTSDLSISGVLEVHNKFWSAHEILSGNVFASIPLGLIVHSQSTKLQHLNWESINVDIYDITSDPTLSTIKLINSIETVFENYLLVREVSGNFFMVLDFKKN